MSWVTMQGAMGSQLLVLLLNTLHHSLLYPMLAGVRVFRPLIPVTGTASARYLSSVLVFIDIACGS